MLDKSQHPVDFQPYYLSMDLQLTEEICLHNCSFPLCLQTIYYQQHWDLEKGSWKLRTTCITGYCQKRFYVLPLSSEIVE